MPIFEFRCLKCNECLEILVMGAQDKDVEMKCTKCGGEELERIMSCTSYTMSDGGARTGNASSGTQSRTCSSGSCTTWTLPGHSS